MEDEPSDTRFDDRRARSRKHFAKAAARGAPVKPKRNEQRRERPHDGSSKKAIRAEIAKNTLSELEDDADTWKAYEATSQQDAIQPLRDNPHHITLCEVWSGVTTLEACRRLKSQQEPKVCALVFASAKNPGGGWLNGANAQEESIARSSGLVYCIESAPMYKENRDNPRGGLYHSRALFSPDVPVIKDEHGMAVDRYYVSFITCPAVNCSIEGGATHGDRIKTMKERCELVLNCAVVNNQSVLVLGAFGCGVFANDPNFVAKTFDTLLRGPYQGQFRRIVYAVLDEDTASVFESHCIK